MRFESQLCVNKNPSIQEYLFIPIRKSLKVLKLFFLKFKLPKDSRASRCKLEDMLVP